MEKRRDIAREIARRYGNLTPEQLDQLSETIVPINVHKGVSILKRGDVCKSIYYVDHGLIRQYYYKNNKEVTEHIAYEGGIVMCIESLFMREPSHIAVESLEPSRLYAIQYDEFEKLTQSSYAFCNILLNILKESLILSQHKADTIRFENAKERYARTIKDHPDIIRRAPLHIVASYLQMTPETLSRVRTAASEAED